MTMPKKKVKAVEVRDSRQHLVDTAAKLFAEHGVKGTSIDRVARTAGISRGSIYWYFGSKSGLVFAVMESLFNAWTLQHADAPPAGQAGLRTFLSSTIDWSHDPRARTLPMLLFEALRPKSSLRSRYADRYEAARAMWRSWLVRSQRGGDADPSIDPTGFAYVAWAAVIGLHLQWRLDPDQVDYGLAHRTLGLLIERAVLSHNEVAAGSDPGGGHEERVGTRG